MNKLAEFFATAGIPEIQFCDICSNPTNWVMCAECEETHCGICFEAYGC